MERFLKWTEDLRNSNELVEVADESRNFEKVTNIDFNSHMNTEFVRENSKERSKAASLDPLVSSAKFLERRKMSHSLAGGERYDRSNA